ncbi:MAG: anthranilate phosphoribosyltransferase [Saprospiraceae bacterium]
MLSRAQARETLLAIHASLSAAQVASFLTVYRMRAIAIEELLGFRDALLELAIPLDLQGQTTIDIVGTGGDGKNTFNISTTSALVVAGAGYKVTKHGSYGVSSSVGSSDLLTSLGYVFTNDQAVLLRMLDEANICFLHAPVFHPALKAVVPVRRELGVQTFFNILGPLVNPAQPTHQLMGTFSQELSRLYHYVMQETGRAYTIVHALDGYDEVSLTGAARVHTPQSETLLHPSDFGLSYRSPNDLHGGDTAADAREICTRILQNQATAAQIDVVCANAGLAIQTLCPHKPLQDCVAEARESIANGSAFKALGRVLQISNHT